MSELLKLKFTPCANFHGVNKGYIVDVEYTEKSLIGSHVTYANKYGFKEVYTLFLKVNTVELFSQISNITTKPLKLIKVIDTGEKAVSVVDSIYINEVLEVLKEMKQYVKKQYLEIKKVKEEREWREQQPFEITL